MKVNKDFDSLDAKYTERALRLYEDCCKLGDKYMYTLDTDDFVVLMVGFCCRTAFKSAPSIEEALRVIQWAINTAVNVQKKMD